MYCSVKSELPIILRILNRVSKGREQSKRKTFTFLGFLQTINAIIAKTNYASEATVEVQPFKLCGLDTGPKTSVKITQADAKKYLTQMQIIRHAENAAANLYKDKIIRGFCHLYNGQEACCVGPKAAMSNIDSLITSYRCHGWAYMMGISIHGILAELTGREAGCTRGKGGSMHVYAKNFYGGNGIVGAQIPLGAGVALHHKYKKTGGVCLTLYGDGAANQGQAFEAFNISSLLKLPVVYICENNKYGMGTSNARAAANPEYYTRGDYIPGIWVDGMDILATRSATKFAIDYAKKDGPIMMEMSTYRFYGHSMSDPGTSYRTREEVAEAREKQDPITRFRSVCIKNKLLSEDDIKKIDADCKKEVNVAVEKSKTDKEIALGELTYDIYAKNYHPFVRGASGEHLKHEVKGPCVNLK